MKKGYTLVEFLIVIGILTVSIGSVLLLLTSVIKGTNQANVTTEIKQNGQVILDSLEKQIRGATDARSLVGGELLGGNSGVFLTFATGENVSIICFNSVAGTANGWIGIHRSSAPLPPTTSSTYQPLTNQELISGVDIRCSGSGGTSQAFSVNPAGAAAKVVVIDFLANQAINAPSRADFLANAQFKTTVSLRDYE